MTTEEWWKKETPQCMYNLTAFEPGGGPIQEVDVTADEFQLLKGHLAKLRGLAEPDPAEKQASNPILRRASRQGFAFGMFSQLLNSVDPLGLELLDDIFHENQDTDGKRLLNDIRKSLDNFAEEHGITLGEAV